jgi:hypothetical protein
LSSSAPTAIHDRSARANQEDTAYDSVHSDERYPAALAGRVAVNTRMSRPRNANPDREKFTILRWCTLEVVAAIVYPESNVRKDRPTPMSASHRSDTR